MVNVVRNIFIILIFLSSTSGFAQYNSIEFFGGGVGAYQGSKSWSEFRESYNTVFEKKLKKPLGGFGLTGGYTMGFLFRTGGFMGLSEFGKLQSGTKVKYDDGRVRHFERYNSFFNAEMGLGFGDAHFNQYLIIGMASGIERLTTYLQYPDGDFNSASNMVLNGTYTAYHIRPLFGLRFSGGDFPGLGYFAGVYFMPWVKNTTGQFNDMDHVKALVTNGLTSIPRDYEAYIDNTFVDDPYNSELYVQSDLWFVALKIGIRYSMDFY